MSDPPVPPRTPLRARFSTSRHMRLAYWVLLLPPLWAALVLPLPPATFATAESYRVMATFGTEQMWALVSAAVFVVGAAGALIGKAWSVHSALAVCGTWHISTALMLFLANPISIMPGVAVAMAALTLLLALRI